MEVSATAAIAIKVAGTDGYFAMPESLEILVRVFQTARAGIFRTPATTRSGTGPQRSAHPCPVQVTARPPPL